MKKLYFTLLALISIVSIDAATFSGTLPVVYVKTSNGAAITSTTDYVDASIYIDPKNSGYTAFGTASSPVAMKIRGRGQTTWTNYEKKPYRIKLTIGDKPLDMSKSKNFVLLPHADDELAFLRNAVGYRLSQCMGLAYTPDRIPVELMLNGQYAGLYFFSETVRVDKDRVNLLKQLDSETDATLITGGWLVQVDDGADDYQTLFAEGNGSSIRFSHKSPEVMSTAQQNYFNSQMKAIDNAVYATNKTSTTWENYLDIDTLARYYIIQEIMDNTEAFQTSTYLYKNRGDAQKWICAPVWDFSNAYRRSTQKFIYEDSPHTPQLWIAEIAKFPRFQAKVQELWKYFHTTHYATLSSYIDQYINSISSAIASDYQRWPAYGTANATTQKAEFKKRLDARINWLNHKWDPAGINDIMIDQTDAPAIYYNLQGVQIENPQRGLYLVKRGSKVTKKIIK